MLFAAVPKTLRVSFLRCCPSKRQAEEVREAREAREAQEAADAEEAARMSGSWRDSSGSYRILGYLGVLL